MGRLPIQTSLQSNGDLGTRLLTALQQGFAANYTKVLILGSDSPGLPASHLTALLQSEADVALGPTPDGGFFAIACRSAHIECLRGYAGPVSTP